MSYFRETGLCNFAFSQFGLFLIRDYYKKHKIGCIIFHRVLSDPYSDIL